MEFISDGHIMKLSQHIIDKHNGKICLYRESNLILTIDITYHVFNISNPTIFS
jgi:hypothetical protein